MTHIFKDQLNRSIRINSTNRIICLVPSITELLIDLGLEDKVVGITKFCIHPNHLRLTKTIIGGTKSVNLNKIKQLKPDLIIANKEENTQKDIEEVSKHYPTWISDVYNVTDAIDMIQSISKITNTQKKGLLIIKNIKHSIAQLSINKDKNVIYLIWYNPIMAAGSNNYINSILKLEGYTNLLNTNKFSRYPEITMDKIKTLNPDILLLSSEPFPFKEKHLELFKKELPKTDIKLVNGEWYSWYGSRMIKAIQSLSNFQLTNVKKS